MPPEQTIPDLNNQFATPSAQIVPGNNGLPMIQITTPAATAEIYLHGAQITSWQPTGAEEILFLSRHSRFEDGKAIRGGIPICFPWFRDKPPTQSDSPKAPAHGVVRTKTWQLASIAQQDDSTAVTLFTESNEATRQLWPHDFHIAHRITIGSELKLELIVTNAGAEPFQFEEALHTYHRVGNIETLRIGGLQGVPYLDNQDSNREKIEPGEILLNQPTDNAYFNTQHPIEIIDPTLHRRVQIETQNSDTTIVWTPWRQGAAATADLGNDEWQHFACVEAGNILTAAITLAPGQQHTLTATIRLATRSILDA